MPSRNSIRGRISRWLIVCTFVVCIAKLANGVDPPAKGAPSKMKGPATQAVERP